jgi:mono/diheme cytochrome c family protein
MHRLVSIALCLCCLGLFAACASTPQAVPFATPRPTQTALPPTATNEPVWGAARGQILFNTQQPAAGFACATCHYPDSDRRLIGPGLKNMLKKAVGYSTGQTLQAYLRESITDPDAFIVPGEPPYPAGLMPENYADIFSEADLKDLIAYLMTL